MPRFVDFHCHLDLYPDPAAAMATADAAEIYTLAVTTTPRAWGGNKELAGKRKHIRVALGLHPQLVGERSAEIELWEKYLAEARYIGEVGLDAGPQFYQSLEKQKQIFERVLTRCAEAGGKILTVHSVRAGKSVLDMIEKHLPASRGTVALHWFTGSCPEARRAVDLGCYFSINGAMLESERGRALVAELPEDRLLTETDGPFTHVDGRPAHPSDIPRLVNALASFRAIPNEEMRVKILQNLKRLCAGDR